MAGVCRRVGVGQSCCGDLALVIGGWFTGVVLLVFAGIGRAVAVHEPRHQTD